jgi:uncharacterized protein YdiU (UPF0061 family)
MNTFTVTMQQNTDNSERNEAALLNFENSFSKLPSCFYTFQDSLPLSNPYLVCTSDKASGLINLKREDFLISDLIDFFSGTRTNSTSKPLAAVYSGHQFGQWAGQLGDGRAILLGNIKSTNGPWELQLKGSGPTPYSRRGDGRAVLRSSIREFLCSEAMFGLGIPTTRALCITGSKDLVYRETVETASVVTRMAPSFIRFGSFEHWYYNEDIENVKILADYTISNFYPELLSKENPYKSLLSEVIKRTAELIAQWQAVGFMHGVMNTDNMSILGLTLDYGPFGFMEAFNQGHICNHSDHQGRYAYTNQPHIGHWNSRALAQALLPLIGQVDEVQEVLAEYIPAFRLKYNELFNAKLGFDQKYPEDQKLVDGLLSILQQSSVDFTLFFRRLSELKADDFESNNAIRDLFTDRLAFDDWSVQYRKRLKLENSIDEVRKIKMNTVNPKYILRNYLLQVAIEKAQKDDFTEVNKLLKIMESPFDEQPEFEDYSKLPPDWAADIEVSCSS